MKIYGYARISTMKQNIDRQIRNIKASYPEAIIIQEEYTGRKIDRPEWSKLLKQLKAGDVVVFDEVSRMSRNAADGFEVYQELYNKGVELVFIKEPHINTSTYKNALNGKIGLVGDKVDFILEGVNKYLMELAKEQIKLAFEQAEKEVQFLSQRTKEGIETARRNDKQIGQRKGAKLTTKKSEEMKKVILKKSKDFGGALNDVELMALTKLSRNTFYKYKKELKAEQ